MAAQSLNSTTFMPGHTKAGFTLLELAIVLAIIGLIMGAGLSFHVQRADVEAYKETVRRIDRVEAALELYVRSYGTLPCPANPRISEEDAPAAPIMPYGMQSCRVDAHLLSVTIAGNRTDGTTRYAIYGAVPTKTLGLSDVYLNDAWGQRLMYVVDNEYSYASAYPVNTSTAQWGPRNGGIIVRDYHNAEITNCTGACPNAGGAIYVLYSTGRNGVGSWSSKGNAANSVRRTSPLNADDAYGLTKERENSLVGSGGVADAPDLIFRDAAVRYTDSSSTYFDDIVRWKARWHFN
jgi:prepilin-type N-terminal cleavage/methylation domain-containing protein